MVFFTSSAQCELFASREVEKGYPINLVILGHKKRVLAALSLDRAARNPAWLRLQPLSLMLF